MCNVNGCQATESQPAKLPLHAVSETRLILTCGSPGAGKTTLATRLATQRRAVRLTKDE
jgi:signal recognition particle GTPase